MSKTKKLGTLDETNFREFAKAAIASYEKKAMVVDAMVWGQIIGHYERALGQKKPRREMSNAHRLAISAAHAKRVALVHEAKATRAMVGAPELPEDA